MTVGVIVQARIGSTRFPGKVYQSINGRCCLDRVLRGVNDSVLADKIILAMPYADKMDFEEKHAYTTLGADTWINSSRFSTFFGHPTDLLERYFGAARQHQLDIIVRVTADCPFTQGWLIDDMVLKYMRDPKGYMANNDTIRQSAVYPDGTDIQIFTYYMLAEAHLKTQDPYHREHVCPYFYRKGHDFEFKPYANLAPHRTISTRFSKIALDRPEDLPLLESIAVRYDQHGDLNRAIEEAV